MLPMMLRLSASSRVENTDPPTTSRAAPNISTSPTKRLSMLERMLANAMRMRTMAFENMAGRR